MKRSLAFVSLVLVSLALWIALSPRMHAGHHGDSLLPVLESLYAWQPYYWGQDRFGMLVPLLAMPFRDPFANLIAQTALTSAAGLALFFAIARFAAWPRNDAAIVAGALAATLFVSFVPDAPLTGVLGAQPYGTALALGGAGLVMVIGAGTMHRVTGALLLGLALWVDIALVFALGPLVLCRALLEPGPASPHAMDERREVVITLGALGAAFLANLVLARTVADVPGEYALLPVTEWPGCWVGLLANGWSELVPRSLAIALALILAVGTAAHVAARGRGAARPALVALAGLTAGGATSLLVLGAISWTKLNELSARYTLPTFLFAVLATTLYATLPLLELLPWRARRAAPATALAALALAVVIAFGRPTPAGVRAALDASIGGRTEDVIASSATHILGNYWRVWPAVFHANLVLSERESGRRVWGVTHRSAPTAKYWARIPLDRWRVAIVPGDEEIGTFLGLYRLPPMVEVERRVTITILAPAGSGPATP